MHIPVLLQEALESLAIREDGIYVDATLGCGGHAEVVLGRLGPGGWLLGFDRDPEAVAAAAARLARFGSRCRLRQGRFSGIADLAAAEGLDAVDGILMDLGVSSLQLDRPERGFSFQTEGPLDMRMNATEPGTAADLVQTLDARELAALLRTYGEEPCARRIAAAIVRERESRPIRTTAHLARIVESATGGRRGRLHPATRTFQALRMAVNSEEDEIREGLAGALSLLRPGAGRLVAISFHSREDRLVKQFFRAHAGREESLQAGGSRRVGAWPAVRLLTRRPIRPTPEEVERNPRARSAKLRAVERQVEHGRT